MPADRCRAPQVPFPNGGLSIYGRYRGSLGRFGQRYRLRLFYSGGARAAPAVLPAAAAALPLLPGWPPPALCAAAALARGPAPWPVPPLNIPSHLSTTSS